MHLVFLNQYYPPDAAPTGVMLEAVVEELARQGHAVTVICAAGGYADDRRAEGRNVEGQKSEEFTAMERSDMDRSYSQRAPQEDRRRAGSKPQRPQRNAKGNEEMASNPHPSTLNPQLSPTIVRLPASRFGRGTFVGKLMDYASYYLGVAWTLMTLRPRPDRIVALTTPPYLSVLARLISKFRGADHAHWVMDLYPDVMSAHGMLGEKSPGYRMLAGLARWGFGGRRCAAVLTLGPDMAERVGKYVDEFTAMERSDMDRSYSRRAPQEDRRRAGSKAQRSRRGAEKCGEGFSDPQLSTRNSQLLPVQWVPLWGAGARVSSPAESMLGENLVRQQPSESVTVDPFTAHRPGESGDSRSDNEQTVVANPTGRNACVTDLRRKRGWNDDELIVMYSGNMGLGHRFGEILEAAGRMTECGGQMAVGGGGMDSVASLPRRMNESRDEFRGPEMPKGFSNSQPSTSNSQLSPTIRFTFHGGGKRRGEIVTFMAAHPEAPVELHDYAPVEELAAHLQSADVHLASLDTAWTGTMVPSKLQGIFAAGRPVIFIGSGESSIGRWVAESGGGWVVAAGDAAGLIKALEEARDPAVCGLRGRAAKDFAAKHFDKRTNVARVAAIFSR